MNGDWFKMYRGMLEWEWYSDTVVTRVFIHCLLSVRYKAGSYKGYAVDIGEFPASQSGIADKLGLTVKQVRTAMKKLEKSNEIATKRANKFLIIKVVAWRDYQGQQVAQGRLQGEDRAITGRLEGENTATLKESNNSKKGEGKNKIPAPALNYNSWPTIPSESILADWLSMRKSKRAKLTQTAIDGIGKQLHLAVQSGHSVDDCISECVTRNWTGFKAEWLQNNRNGSKQNRPTESRTLVQQLEDEHNGITGNNQGVVIDVQPN